MNTITREPQASIERRSTAARDLPLVSVIIPCYNQAHFLAQAIESTLAQSYPRLEVVVVDDGSADNTAGVAASFAQVHCVRQSNRGVAAARNAGRAHSHGDFVVFLDADDRLLPSALETGATLLQQDPSLGFVAGLSRFISHDGVPQPTGQPARAEGDAYLALLRRNSIRNPAMVMFRRRVLDEVGPFDSRFDACADYVMYLRISRSHPVRFHSGVVAEYRKHDENMSRDSGLMLRQVTFVLRLQRQFLVTRERRDAFRAGLRNVREYYGDRLATQIRTQLRKPATWPWMVRDIAVLGWHHPRGVTSHVLRKISVSLSGPSEEPPSEDSYDDDTEFFTSGGQPAPPPRSGSRA